jgi:RimJ/RimL family protein N-acetyltransferase
MPHPYWPLFDLRIRTPRLELRLGTEDDLIALAGLAASGIHEPGFMPFLTGWSRKPSPEIERGTLQWHWRARALWTPEDWSLDLVVLHDGEVVGTQGVRAQQFALLRSVNTGSWLGRAWQGRGLGKEMRAAVLHLAFEGLGAQVAHTEAFTGNAASLGVTRALGYEPNGVALRAVEDKPTEEQMFRLTRERWTDVTRPAYQISVESLEPCLPLFGAS